MTKYLLAAAALAASVSTAAFAGDGKPVQMTDEQMDQVTAGAIIDNQGVFGTTGPLAAGTPPNAVGVNLLIKKTGKTVVEFHSPGAP